MSFNKGLLHRSLLPKFETWMLNDGWTICEIRQPHQAFRAFKEKHSGNGKKWAILNFSPDADSDMLMAAKFSASMVTDFIRELDRV